jgi:hypothetical protein
MFLFGIRFFSKKAFLIASYGCAELIDFIDGSTNVGWADGRKPINPAPQ